MRIRVKRCRLHELLAAKEWTQKHLSERTGIDQSTLSSYYTSRRLHMPLINAVLISDALGVNERDLYEWEIIKESKEEAETNEQTG